MTLVHTDIELSIRWQEQCAILSSVLYESVCVVAVSLAQGRDTHVQRARITFRSAEDIRGLREGTFVIRRNFCCLMYRRV